MNPIDRTQIGPLHACYRKLTGLDIRNTIGRIWRWEMWLLAGFTETDLVLVVKYIKGKIQKSERRTASLQFNNLIENTERFEEDLAMARALSRIPRVDPNRASVLQAVHRPATTPQPDAKPVSDIIAAHKAFEAFRNFGKSL